MSGLLRSILLLLCLVTLPGCYLLQAAQGQMSLTLKREPIDTVLKRSQTPPALRQRLTIAQQARAFASRELALPDNRSYTGFVQLNRPYVLWNVLATPALSLEPVRWCFPIAGCVVYRGYFREAAAQRFARSLRQRGYDAVVTGVPAYSTLGHFDDPFTSAMTHWSEARMVGTLFHELAHQVLYVPGDSAFNEAFADAVEEIGLERWFAQQRQAELRRWQAASQRAEQFTALLLETRTQLQALYASALPRDEKLARKQQVLGELKFRYWQLRQGWQGETGYDAWFNRALSNADFVAVATYQRCVAAFLQVYADEGHDLPRFYAAIKQVASRGKAARQRFCDAAEAQLDGGS